MIIHGRNMRLNNYYLCLYKQITYLDGISQRFPIQSLVLSLNFNHVDLTSHHHYSYQLSIVCAQSFHALVQSFRKERRLVLYGPDNGQETFFRVSGKLILDSLLDVVSGDALVLLEDELQLGVITLTQHHVEGGLVGAHPQLSGSQECLCVCRGTLLIGHHAFVSTGVA